MRPHPEVASALLATLLVRLALICVRVVISCYTNAASHSQNGLRAAQVTKITYRNFQFPDFAKWGHVAEG